MKYKQIMDHKLSCPKCDRYLAFRLSMCIDGRCPFCGYKPGDDDLREGEGRRSDKRAAEIQDSIRQILYHDWSQIGFVGLLPKDEFDSYIGSVYRILASSRSEQELVEYLARAGDDIVGTAYTSSNHDGRLRPVARKLLELDVKL